MAFNSTPRPIPPEAVLFEDGHLLVLNKPNGLLTQAPPGIPSLESDAKEYVRTKYAKPGGVYLAVPHRLDRPVSGALCFVRNTQAAQRVQAEFEAGRVRKVYWAVIEGRLPAAAATWEDWMRKVPDEARAEIVPEGSPGAKRAVLDVAVVRELPAGTLVRLEPRTGRMHQLRVQCASRGVPILGDAQYGAARPFGPPADLPRDRWIALHARELGFAHPFGKGPLTFVAPPPAAWGDVGVEI